ncbi:pentatricopeptide repeat-containing protein, partial [Trifolium medium]|nr:pentatricopeptide repeat-containing protein [Trifolium medium]
MVRSGFSPKDNAFWMLVSAYCMNEYFGGAMQAWEKTACIDVVLCSEIEAKRLWPQGFDGEKIVITSRGET